MKKVIVLLLVCFLGFISVNAQISQGGFPVSFNKVNLGLLQSIIPTQAMPSVNIQRLTSEDLVNDLNKEIPWRFGENIPVDIDIKTDGVYDFLPNGDKLYRIRIYSPGAFSINLTFDNYKLPPGAKFFIYNAQKTQVYGAFTNFNNQADNYFATSLIQGDAIYLEYFEPKNSQFAGLLHLSRVTHGYRNVLDFTAKAFGTSGTCNNNVVCPIGTGWDNEIKSVCMLVVGGAGFCTGTLVNNTAQDGTPYILTANHCSTANDFASWVFWWNWQSVTCTNPGASPAHDQTTTSGSVLKARNAGSDFCLVQMNQTPPSTFNVYYAGWNYGTTAATSAMCIHHPDGDIKKISSAGAATSSTFSGAQTWNVNWTSGVTEPGSSGSPLFDQNHLIIGQLYGGLSACGAAPGNMNDDYGKFSISWSTGGTPTTQLANWLDPANLNPTTLIGLNPNVPAVALDAKANAIIIPTATYCTIQNITPTVEILNSGTTNLTSLTVRYNIDGGTNISQNWTGNLATNVTAQITFPQITLTTGTHRFNFSVTSPNGGVDLNLANDTLSIQYVVGGTNLPFTEGFESGTFPPNLWTINNLDGSITWTSAATSGNGTSTTSAFIDFFNYNPVGELDDLVSPVIDLTGLTNVSMTFNVAYVRFDPTTNDGLDIYISTDCGVTFNPTPIYSKSGTTLATGADNQNAFTPSVTNDWRLETIDLTPYVGNNVVLQFQAVNAFGNNLYIDDINIFSSTIPPVADFAQSDTSSCIGNILFTDLSTNTPTTWLWDFGDGTTATIQNPSHTYTTSGYFTVSLTATNTFGNNTVSRTNLIHINLPTVPITADVARCGTGTVTLTASGSGILQWFDAATAGNYLGTGTSYTTPSITTTTPYYIENHIEQTSQYVTTPLSNINGATYNNADECWLVFDALTDIKLVSVEVNASTAGNRLIELRDNAGTAIYSVTINIPLGVSRINLGFNIPVGTGYMLVGPPNANLWRSSTAVVAYPYSLTGIVDIISGGRTTSPVVTTRYYYFHNWEVKLADCISSRVVANAVINTSVVAGTASASPASIVTGSISTLTLTGSSGNIQWQQSANGLTGWANVTGGTGATTANYTTGSLTTTTYYRAVISSTGCTSTNSNVATVAVLNNPLLANITATTNVNCNGASTGSAIVTVSGGTSPYTYIWSNGTFNDTISNLAAGVYTVTVIDGSLSNTTTSVTITEPTIISITTTPINVSCFGDSNGSISLAVSGGTFPYTYFWSNTATSQNINSLVAGSYKVTITDSLNCIAIDSSTITQPTLLSAIISAQTNVSCNTGNNGSATVSASGGTGIYTYNWSTGGTVATVTLLTQGTYAVTVTDANTCTSSASATITQPLAITLTTGTTPATCGNADGSATVTPSGGTGTYTYLWSSNASTATVTAIAAGSFSVTVTDANFCTATATANVSNIGGPTLSVNITNTTCNGLSNGSATVNASGGSGAYTYNWSNAVTSATNSNIAAGTYGVTVTDAGCISTTTATVSEPAPFVASYTATPILCFGGNSTVVISATGGTPPYTGTGTYPIPAGTYTIPITDANNCTSTISGTITEPAAIALTTNVTNATCGNINGLASVTATGGTGVFTYLWSNAATTATINNLAAGTYTVTATDSNGCTATSIANIGNMSSPTATTSVTDATCGAANGSATVTATGGTGAYTYNWSNAATSATINNIVAGFYSVTVTDANLCTATATSNVSNTGGPTLSISGANASCNGTATGSATITAIGGATPYTYIWSSGGTGTTENNLSSGSYSVSVTDNNNCVATASINITEPTAIVLTTAVTDATCGASNGLASVIATGGTGAYSYLWSNVSTATTINNVVAGSYSVTVTDANGCTANATANISNAGSPTLTITGTNLLCNGGTNGSATVSTTGGISPYSYLWSTGSVSTTVNNISAGTYSVSVTDNNACVATASIVITEPQVIALTTSIISASCSSSNGSAGVSVTGGTGAYTYLWSNASTNPAIFNVPAGSYNVTVTDANLCTATATSNVSNTGGPTLTISGTNASCNGTTTGSATVTATGGATPYTYIWSSGGTGTTENNLGSGSYSVSITDNNNCVATASINITEPTTIVLTTAVTDATCGASNGSVLVTVTGGINPYTYLWSTGSLTLNQINLGVGSYTLTVTDANACIANTNVTVNNTGSPVLTINSSGTSCNGGNNGSATVTATGGIAPYTYLWSTGIANATVGNLSAGSYSVTVTDNNGCISTSEINIMQPTAIVLNTGTSSASCGSSDGSAVVVASGGTGTYTYNWSNGVNTETINNLAAGVYFVTATDINNCTATSFANVSNAGAAALTITGTSIACNGNSNGSATVSTTGGASPYSYYWSTGATIATINNLSAGTYFTSVTDANGCIATSSLALTEPDAIVISISGNNASCYGSSNGNATVSVTGGTPDYTYIWSNGGISTTITNLPASVYNVTITDNNGCISNTSVTITEPQQIVVTPVVSDVTISGGNDGAVNLTVSGGVAPFSFAWSNGIISQNINNLTAGNYTVTLSDGNGCSLSQTYTVLDGPTSLVSQIIPYEICIFPNPCNNLLNIDFATEYKGDLEIKIINIEGKTIYVNKFSKGSFEFNQSLDLSRLMKGVYSLQIQTLKDLVKKLIIIQ